MNSSIDGTIDEIVLQRNLREKAFTSTPNKNHKHSLYSVAAFSSQNLLMSPIAECDEPLYRTLFSDPDVTKYTGGVVSGDRLQLCFEKSITELTIIPTTYITWVVQIKEQNESIGILNLILHRKPSGSAELGIMFIKKFQNKGYCCELLKTVIDYCFTQMSISSLFSFTLNSNKPVAHILHKLDFEKLAVSPLEPPSPDGSYWAIYNT